MSRSVKFLLLCSLILVFSTAFRAAGPMPLSLAATPAATMAATAEGVKVPNTGLRPDAPPYALHGPFWVGMKLIEAKTDFHPTTVAVWYPALNPTGVADAISQSTAVGSIMMRAIPDAAPDPSAGPYPLVVSVHGLGSQHFYATYLSENLASHGFVVMAIDYADSSATPGTDGALSMYTRPKDVSWQLDYADRLTGAGGALQGLIDTQHVAVVGHSLGGYTALAVGGAQLDLGGPTSMCVRYPDLTLPKEMGDMQPRRDLCDHAKQVADLVGLKAVPGGLWPSWGDPRVDAIVPLAPGAFTFGSESIKAVAVPAMVLVGSKDRTIFSALPIYQPYVYDNLGSTVKSLAVFEDADHSMFGNDCDTNRDWAGAGYFWACSDPVWDMDRAHDLINHFTTAFLLDVLKGDKDAHKALLPDAVKFAGITYKTTMK